MKMAGYDNRDAKIASGTGCVIGTLVFPITMTVFLGFPVGDPIESFRPQTSMHHALSVAAAYGIPIVLALVIGVTVMRLLSWRGR